MSFLSPTALWVLAAGIVVIVLYLVRRRRRPLPVPLLSLWLEAAREEAPRTKARRIRSIVSLLVELLIVAAAGLALARPFRPIELPEPQTIGVVVDLSPTLDTRNAAGERRLDRAKGAVRRLLEGLSPTDSALVVTTHRGGTVVSPLGAPRRDALAVLESLPISVEPDPVRAAERAAALVGDRQGTVVFVSDLATAAARDVASRGDVKTIPVTDDASNVGIIRFTVEGEAGKPRRVRATIRNFSTRPATRTARLVRAGSRAEELGERALMLDAGGEAAIEFPLPDRLSGEIALRLEPGDGFTEDDVAAALIPGDAGVSVLVLASGEASPFLRTALAALAPRVDADRCAVARPESYADLHGSYALAIFDRCSPAGPLLGPAILIGSEWAPLPLRTGTEIARVGPVEVSREDPIVRNLDFDELRVGRARRIETEGGAPAPVLLRSGNDALLVVSRGDPPFAVCGFTFEESNLGLVAAFPILLSHLIDELSAPALASVRSFRPGDTIDAAGDLGLVGAMPALFGAAGRVVASLDDSGHVPWIEPAIYRIRSPQRSAAFAVNVERAEWSDVRCGAAPSRSGPLLEPRVGEGKQELWLLFATATLALLALHWFLFGTGAPRR